MQAPNIVRDGNRLIFSDLAHITSFSSFQKVIYEGSVRGYDGYILDFRKTNRVFPDAVVPIAAYLDLYKTQGYEFEVTSAPPVLVRSRFMSPITIGAAGYRDKINPISTVWRFQEAGEVGELVTLFVRAFSTHHACATGILESFEWCLNEIMDNVLQHSNGSSGFAMMQIHRTSERVAICIADCGQGLLNSLQTSKYHPTTSLDAITLAIKAGVTRDPNIGQGNGLWGLSEVVRRNKGRLNIVSGNSSLYFDGFETKTFPNLPSNRAKPGAVIDFQINTNNPINISEALGGGQYEHVNVRMEALETEQVGEFQINVQEVAHGTGTRRSGERVRNLVLNTFADGAYRVILDFSGIGMISSSFADELIGKLVAHFGFSSFCQKIMIRQMNPTIQALIDHSVAQRMSVMIAPK